jgi:hypothetical protein
MIARNNDALSGGYQERPDDLGDSSFPEESAGFDARRSWLRTFAAGFRAPSWSTRPAWG